MATEVISKGKVKLHLEDTANLYAPTLLRFARSELNGRFGLAAPYRVEAADLPDAYFEKVTISLKSKGRQRGCMGARGLTLAQAITSACDAVLKDKRFGGPLVAAELPYTRIELWIQYASEIIDNSSISTVQDNFTLGADGIELRHAPYASFYVPSVPITSRISSHRRLLEKLSEKANLPADAWQSPRTILKRTRWLHLVESTESETGACRFFRMRSQRHESLNASAVERASQGIARRLMAMQRADGSYNYYYDALRDEMNNESFSMVRMGCAAYAMSWASQGLQDPFLRAEVKESATRGVGFLLTFASPFRNSKGGLFISEGTSAGQRQRGKLGATALTLLALQFADLGERFSVERELLLQTILAMQNDADGSFQCFTHMENSETTNHNFYPGEALLALCREARAGRSMELHRAIERAFPFYYRHFTNSPETSFVLWQADAWRLFHEQRGAQPFSASVSEAAQRSESSNQIYADFVFKQADWVCKFQYTPDNAPAHDHVGSFRSPPHQGFTSTLTEALIRACGLAFDLNLKERVGRYRRAAILGLSNLLRLQIKEEESYLFPRAELAVGGVPTSLTSFKLRSDCDAHALTAFLAALETPVLFEE